MGQGRPGSPGPTSLLSMELNSEGEGGGEDGSKGEGEGASLQRVAGHHRRPGGGGGGGLGEDEGESEGGRRGRKGSKLDTRR